MTAIPCRSGDRARSGSSRVARTGDPGQDLPPAGLAIDPGARTARVEAGVLWGEVGKAAEEHGVAALAGSSPDVGVVGIRGVGGSGGSRPAMA